MAMSSSSTDRSVSQNNSERLSSSRTSTAACSECPQRFWTVPLIPANCLFRCPSLTRTTVPLSASLASMSLSLLHPPWWCYYNRVALVHPATLYHHNTTDAQATIVQTIHGTGNPSIVRSSWYQ